MINEDALKMVCDAAEEIASGDDELIEAIAIVREHLCGPALITRAICY